MKKESILIKEGVFGCDGFNLHFWKQRRSTLLWRVVFTAVGKKQVDSFWRRSPKRSCFSQRKEKQVDFWWHFRKIGFHNVKEKQIDSWVSSSRWIGVGSFIVFDRTFSILPMIFFSCPSWRRYCQGLRHFPRSLLPSWDRLVERYCDQIQTTGVEKMLWAEMTSSSGSDVAAFFWCFIILGQLGFLSGWCHVSKCWQKVLEEVELVLASDDL